MFDFSNFNIAAALKIVAGVLISISTIVSGFFAYISDDAPAWVPSSRQYSDQRDDNLRAEVSRLVVNQYRIEELRQEIATLTVAISKLDDDELIASIQITIDRDQAELDQLTN